jgi:hypothetical protein
MDYVRGLLCALGLMLVSGCAIIAGLDHTYKRDDDDDDDGEFDTSSSTATATATATAGSGTSGGAGGAAGSGGAGGSAGVGGSGGGAGGAPNVQATFVQLGLYMNCKLPNPGTMVLGGFDVKYKSNSGGAVPTKVTNATLTMSNGPSSYEWTFTVTPEDVVATGLEKVVTHKAEGELERASAIYATIAELRRRWT